jgi:hypothetical protein
MIYCEDDPEAETKWRREWDIFDSQAYHRRVKFILCLLFNHLWIWFDLRRKKIFFLSFISNIFQKK